MKHFQVPQDITVKPWAAVQALNPGSQPETMSFSKYATFVWLDDVRAYMDDQGKGSIVRMRRWQKVIDQFENTKPGEFISLDDEDYESLKKIVETPTKFFHAAITMACLSFSEVILDAKSEMPVVMNGKKADVATSLA